MGYGVTSILAQPTSSPVASTGGDSSGNVYKDPNLGEWYWKSNSHVDPDATMTAPGSGSGFSLKAFYPVSAITGITTTTPILTFSGSRRRMLSFRTKISGEFTITFKIMSGGNHPTSGTEADKIRQSADVLSFGHANNAWSGYPSRNNPVYLAYNTTTHQITGGTWTPISTLRAYASSGAEDFNNQQFTSFSVTYTLPADAYIAFIQGNVTGSETNPTEALYEYWALADVELTYNLPTSLSGYNAVQVSSFTSHWSEMQRILNGGVLSTDISTTPWVDTYHLKPMRFYGSPAPRVECISGDVHYRFERTASMLYKSQGEDFMPIHGLAATIHVAPPFHDTTVTALVRCNFFAEESDGASTADPERIDLCDFALMVLQGNGTPQQVPCSLRNLFREGSDTNIGKKSISMINRVNLSVGVNHVYVGIRFAEGDENRGRVLIARKVFLVDVKYV
tara:strand:- start:719 stop:2071 length:1353 start_codon:yes stop_codon:yes gene_type:complete